VKIVRLEAGNRKDCFPGVEAEIALETGYFNG